MILKVEIDLEDLTEDLFDDENYRLKEGVISSIRRQVETDIKNNCREQIESQIRRLVELKVGVLIRETFLEWFKAGKIKSGSAEVPLEEYLLNYFTQQTGYTYTQTAKNTWKTLRRILRKNLKKDTICRLPLWSCGIFLSRSCLLMINSKNL